MPPKLLTDTKAKTAKRAAKPYRLYDSGGLYLEIHPNGSKYWRWKYRRHDGKESRIAFGKYPQVSIAQARALRDECAHIRASGADPAIERKRRKSQDLSAAENTFQAVAEMYLNNQKSAWSEIHHRNIANRLKKDI